MNPSDYLARLWHRLEATRTGRWSDVTRGFENERDPNAWCLMTPAIEVSDADVTVGLRIPEPHARQAHTEVRGQTLVLAVLKSGEDLERAPLLGFFRRAIRLPVPVAGACCHRFEGPFLVVTIPREPEASRVTRPEVAESQQNGRVLRGDPASVTDQQPYGHSLRRTVEHTG